MILRRYEKPKPEVVAERAAGILDLTRRNEVPIFLELYPMVIKLIELKHDPRHARLAEMEIFWDQMIVKVNGRRCDAATLKELIKQIKAAEPHLLIGDIIGRVA